MPRKNPKHLKRFLFTKADFQACKSEGSRSAIGKCMARRVKKRLKD